MINSKIIADSISSCGKRITTFELQYPRFIHSEVMTHSLLAKNSSSSRAVPVKKMLELVRNNPASPIHWGKNQPGMVSAGELEGDALEAVKLNWFESAKHATSFSEAMSELGCHKEVSNRITEPYQWMKVILTGTEFENFFWLRDADDAQPEIASLARQMKKLRGENEPTLLYPGEWHLPYITTYRGEYCDWPDYIDPLSGESLSLEEAKTVSMARCAAVSYRTENIGLDKSLDIYKKLFSGNKVHASPAMHQATPMKHCETLQDSLTYMLTEKGVTHLDCYGALWSGNLQGWIQQRQLLSNHCKRG